MSRSRQRLGKIGEDLACSELERRGYVILARRYRRAGGELDIVARDGQTLAFVEVKTRQGQCFGTGAEAISVIKKRRIASVAIDYVVRHGLTGSACRFDVIAIDLTEGGPRIKLFQSAFDVP